MMHHHHNTALVFLSILIAIFSSYTALDLANSITLSHRRVKWPWLICGSLAMGVGIWSMHFIGMLALKIPDVPIYYNIPLLIASALAAVIASAFTLYLVSQDKLFLKDYIFGSLSMGAAIAGMHYIAIWGMRLPADIHWNFGYVTASIIVAISASFVALLLAFKLREDVTARGFWARGAGSILMGFGIAGMHYTAMEAMSFTPNFKSIDPNDFILATDGLATILIIGTLIILGIALIGSNIDRVLSRKTSLAAALEEAVRARDEFLSVASHELKTPLTAVKLQNQLIIRSLKKDGTDIDRLTNMHEQINKSLDRLTRLVDDLLDISRISTGKLSLHLEKFDLIQMINDIVERLQPLLNEFGCLIEFQTDKEIWGEWDRLRLEQVVINLLTNAARYGSGTPIIIKANLEDQKAIICIKDFGKGISLADQERIFQRFERAESSHETRGLGLGLFIVKEIIQMHQGKITVKSEIDKGSEFIVTIPSAQSGSV